jgi:hypothetical protein
MLLSFPSGKAINLFNIIGGFFLAKGYSHKFPTIIAICNNLISMYPHSTSYGREEIAIAMFAEPSFEFSRYWN